MVGGNHKVKVNHDMVIFDVEKVSGQDPSDLTLNLRNFFLCHAEIEKIIDIKVLQDSAAFHCLIFYEKKTTTKSGWRSGEDIK